MGESSFIPNEVIIKLDQQESILYFLHNGEVLVSSYRTLVLKVDSIGVINFGRNSSILGLNSFLLAIRAMYRSFQGILARFIPLKGVSLLRYYRSFHLTMKNFI